VSCGETKTFSFHEETINLEVGESKTLNYTSSDTVLFSLSSDGIITLENDTIQAISEGSVIITGKIKGSKISKTVEVVVTKKEEPILLFNETTIHLNVNDIYQLNYQSSGEVLFSLPMEGIISLNNDVITALSAGSVKVTLTLKGSDLFKELIVIVKEPEIVLEEIVVTGVSELSVGSTTTLSYKLIPNTGQEVLWRSSDSSIASVQNGVVSAHKEGSVIITASVGEIEGHITLTIKDVTSFDEVEIYYLNDLHGAIEPSSNNLGLAYIGNFIEKRRLENPNLILLGGGDMLQGSALSNYYEGKSTLKLMDMMGFDAMVLGNHEFDWGLETVTNEFDPQTGSVSFPLLAINVREKATNQLPNNVKPYTMIEKNGLKVGVIGVIGENIENTIAYSRVKDYEFISSLMLVRDAARQLRSEGAHYITVVIHDQDSALNSAIAQLVGDEKVDAIFNAHFHWLMRETLYNKPILQSGYNGSHVGYMKLVSDGYPTTENIRIHDDFSTPSSTIQSQIDIYKAETDPIFYDLIIKNQNAKISRNDLSNWLAKLMRIKTGADIAFHNKGGTRAEIAPNENIHLAKLYQIWPFDNVVKTVKLRGSYVKQLMYNGSLVYDSDLVIDNYTEYLVATNDYVFDHADNQSIFNEGTNHTNTGIVLRDLAEGELILQSNIYAYFDPTNPIQTIYVTKEDYNYLYL